MRLIERNLDILESLISGKTSKDIQKQYDLTHQGVSQVVKRTTEKIASVYKRRCQYLVPSSYHLIYKLRENKSFWLLLIKHYRRDVLGIGLVQQKLL